MPQALGYQAYEGRPWWTPIRALHVGLLVLALIGYVFAFGVLMGGGVGGVAFGFPFVMFPLVVNTVLLFCWHSSVSQSMIFAASVAHAAWVAIVFVDVRYIHPDPQGPIAFVFVGLVALPVLAAIWITAGILDRRRLDQ